MTQTPDQTQASAAAPAPAASATLPISLLVCALGGEGGGVLTEWLVDAARHAGYPVQATSIPGVAQRTGATTYYLEFLPLHESELGGRRPVLGLYPVPGRLDALLSSELLETVRQMSLGHASPDRTLVISSSARALTTQEKMQAGDGRRDNAALQQRVAQHSRAHHIVDMAGLTRQAGTVVSAVMLGSIAASGALPMKREDYEHVLSQGGSSAGASLRGFGLGYDAVQAQRGPAHYLEQILPAGTTPQPGAASVQPALPASVAEVFPRPLHELLALGHARLTEYQGASYAGLYIRRLERVLQAEKIIDPQGLHGLEITREAARWLALWMAFDDIVRVADLKSRQSRWHRVLGEVQAGASDLVKVYDHFKPGVAEFAALLPPPWARRVQAWDQRRTRSGRTPWALPLKIGTHSIGGMLALRALATLRWLRPHGSRYRTEQELIGLWLDAVVDGAGRHWALGHELAQCGRLIKGYGSTNERGKENLLHITRQLAHITALPDDAARAAAVAQARQAAMADDAGQALDRTLTAHGVATRPVKEQPIRWVRRPPPSGTSRR